MQGCELLTRHWTKTSSETDCLVNMGKDTQPANDSTVALLELKRRLKEALLTRQQLVNEHQKVLEREQAMQMLKRLQSKARKLAEKLKEAVSSVSCDLTPRS